MRLNLLPALLLATMSTLATTASNAHPLEDCLQQRLDQVLAGDAVRTHTNLPGLLQLVIERGNYLSIKDDPVALELFEDAIVTVISERIAKRGKDFRGATLSLIENEDKYSAEGVIVSAGEPYNISITFPSRESCLVNDISIHGAFTLREWVRDQPEVQALMDAYEMKM